MLVVGAGVLGLAVAWQLLLRGHSVRLIDPGLDSPDPARSGSWAALGVLMADVFHRSSGRAWRLRQRSRVLWEGWLADLEASGHPVQRRRGLLLLADGPAELERQQRLVEQRQRAGIPLELWDPAELAALHPPVPHAAAGGLYAPRDGQLDPASLLTALWQEARTRGLDTSRDAVASLERSGRDWLVRCRGGTSHTAAWLVICAGVSSSALLEPLGHRLPLQPVLGQALELQLANAPEWNWPGTCVWRGFNLVPRPDRNGGARCWLGATLEPGEQASAQSLADLRGWAAAELPWLAAAEVVRHWQGLRCRPAGRPAPLLEQLEPGLLLVSGHYRNGVLLAPASAEWACQQIGAGR
ncbi:FAD-binding oxidoreductase [Synechococcus sp. GFB01]|uniref:NAD(P)/FAD-dependent oxidoreductase n=1 Tax=Synechococcus sp. GFB01 TaxID=1662190 RepID=UPI00069FF501|nr:FAD-dependent oxidoreductase [Synechococcus sp. GFB01]